ncbi:O-antigen ligase family protein [Rahnella laticis]|uniref:O-antigen ligase family protein n=1 Tax=Rahnella laticis TaxID=2787622 RepID=UPI0018A2F935|nr:O-antigen ligase family protein [Rahnella laticis]MBF7995452.1 O-antigen ligase family protein [Rahnella laticis]
MLNHNETRVLKIIVNTTVIGLCISLALSMFVTGLPQKVFYVLSYVSFFTVLYAFFKKHFACKSERLYLGIFLSLVFLAVVRFTWAMIFKHDGVTPSPASAGIINNYLLGSKRILLGAFILLCFSVYGFLVTKRTILLSKIIITIGLMITLGVGLHEHLTLNERIKLTTDAASISSYMVIFIYCAHLGLSRLEHNASSKILDLIAFVVTFAILYLCGTRITVLALIFLKITFMLIEYKINLIRNWRVTGLILLAIAVILGVTGKRWAQGVNDIQEYDVQSSTSLGARMAIWESGNYFMRSHLGFSSPDERTEIAREFIKMHHPENIEGYTNVQYNMHNEFLEVTTLQGLSGTLSLLLIYGVIIVGGIRKCDIKGVMIPFIVLFITGLTDSVILYSQTATLFVIALAICSLKPFKAVN